LKNFSLYGCAKIGVRAKRCMGGGGRGGEERKRLPANLRVLKTLFTQKIAQRGIPPISHKSKKK